MAFKRWGKYEVDRDLVESMVLSSFDESIKNDPDLSRLSEFEIHRLRSAFRKSPAFKQAVDANIRQVLDMLELEEESQ